MVQTADSPTCRGSGRRAFVAYVHGRTPNEFGSPGGCPQGLRLDLSHNPSVCSPQLPVV